MVFSYDGFCDVVLTVVRYLKNAWEYMFGYTSHRIQDVNFVYVRDGKQDTEDVTLEYTMDGAQGAMKDMSKDVTDFFFEVYYRFNNASYVYVTRDPNHVFPPPKPAMSFRVPVKEAFLLDSHGVAMYNVTQDIKMYEGPNCDFHGETLHLRDLNLNEPECTVVRFVSAIGVVAEYNVETDSVSHQTIWSPSKTLVLQDWQHCILEPENDSPPPA